MKTIQENINKNIEAFKSIIKDSVEERFKEDNSVEPVAFGLVMKDDKFGIAIIGGLEALFVSNETKRLLPAVMEKLTTEIKPIALAFVTEAWQVIANPKDVLNPDGSYKTGLSASTHPDRKESVVINFETHDKVSVTSWLIDRSNEKVKLDLIFDQPLEVKDPKNNDNFGNLLKKNYSEVAQKLEVELKNSMN